jgi:hypothetical protein
MDEPVIPMRLRSEVDAELADYGFRIRDLDKLIRRESRFLERVEADLEWLHYSAEENARVLQLDPEGGEAEANSPR